MIMRDSMSSSMQVTRAADYAVRVMIYLLGRGTSGRVSLPTLAAATGAPVSFLSKVLQSLTHGGLLVSQRGQTGGFEISQQGQSASMLEVIEAVDGPIRLNVCVSPDADCPRKAWCAANPVWVRAQKAMLEVLAGASMRGLVPEINSMKAPEVRPVRLAEHFGQAAEGTTCTCMAQKPVVHS